MKTKHMIVPAMIAILAISSSAFAQDNRWERNHPRRDEVNDRLRNQDYRIGREYRQGELSGREAAGLHRDDYRISREENHMAYRDGGHLTGRDYRVLNHQENRVSRRIGR